MKLTNDQMFQSILVMRVLNEKGKLGYAIARNLRRISDAAKEFLDIRDELLKKYGVDNGNGQYVIPNEKAFDFSKELTEYANIEHDVDIYQIGEDVFVSGNLDSQQMYLLDWMVADES